MELTISSLDEFTVLELLKTCSVQFSPNLSKTIDLQQYASKLHSRAQFVLLEKFDSKIAFIAFYKNNEDRSIYIPVVWVDNQHARQGIASKMLSYLHNQALKSGYKKIRLEVRKSNIPALDLYTSLGYTQQEERGQKLLLEKQLE